MYLTKRNRRLLRVYLNFIQCLQSKLVLRMRNEYSTLYIWDQVVKLNNFSAISKLIYYRNKTN